METSVIHLLGLIESMVQSLHSERKMKLNLLEQFIEPGWVMRNLSEDEKEGLKDSHPEMWVHIDCRVRCYGRVSQGRNLWVKSDWLDAVRRGFYRA